ncbi:nitrilase-related carbon-nitrogen hydrolase [Agrobacterium radiobacter]|uniref:nitrilase-related carbon-nitrogen hydrolase n=1 Tax=Agrobacterium radiobacter TaxID=362 RepID=UPI003CE451B8
MHASTETFPGGDTWTFLSKTAARHGVTLHAGSIVEKEGEDFYNTSLVFGPDGQQIARYRKIHLFDVNKDKLGKFQANFEQRLPGQSK